MIKQFVLCLFTAVLLSSCASKQKIIYFQNIASASAESENRYIPRLQQDDLLTIIVSAPNPEAAIPFNLSTISVTRGVNASAQNTLQTYLIDNTGNIEFPVIGTIKLGGLTRAEAIEKLTKELEKYIKDPIINMRIVNYKISVLGEVVRPGTFEITSERITLPQAISMAGDMTIYGMRNNILIIRETDGKKTHNFVDMTKADFISSPYYYLSQNDVVYIEPNKTRVNSSVIGPNLTVGISAISLLITIISISTR